ncbi:MAG: EAL and HDOD domain-containing protein [Burkholderiales bacterium]
MAAWFSRWLGKSSSNSRKSSESLTHSPSGVAVLTDEMPVPKPIGAFELDSAASVNSTLASLTGVEGALMDTFAVRRPLIGSHGSLAGFELSLHNHLGVRLQAHPKALSAYAVALLSAAQSISEAGRSVLLTLPGELILSPPMAERVPQGAWLVMRPWADGQQAQKILAGLRSKGVRVGCVVDEASSTGVHPDFVRLSWNPDDPDSLLEQIADFQGRYPNCPLVATEINNIDNLERVLRCRVALASGCLERSLVPNPVAKQRPVQPGAVRLLHLLNEVMTAETNQLAANISMDVVLSYKLLRFVNSPAMGLSRAIDSIDQAVMMLGRKEIYRWISVLILASSDGLQASWAIQEVALWRGRLMEGLAQIGDRADTPPAVLFTVGLLSLLDVLLQVPLQQALQPLNLSAPAMGALLERSGPWASYLNLVLALETQQNERALELAHQFGGLAKVIEVSDEAWIWAAEAIASIRASSQ